MKLKNISNFFAVVEIRTKLVSASTLLLAALYVTWRRHFPDPLPFALMTLATLAVDMGTTAFNNYFDYWRGTDHYRDVFEPDKVLIHAGVEPGYAFWSAFWCFAAAIALGVALAFTGHPWVIPAGAACMTVGFLYTGGPFPISRTPFGELFAGGCLGLALFAIACAVWSVPADRGVLAAGLPSLFWIAAILTVNNTCDIAGDREAGRKTLSILLGAKGGEAVVVALGFLAQAIGIAAAWLGFLPPAVVPALALACLPLTAILLSLHRSGYSHATKGPNMGKILLCLLTYTVFLSAGYSAAFILRQS